MSIPHNKATKEDQCIEKIYMPDIWNFLDTQLDTSDGSMTSSGGIPKVIGSDGREIDDQV